LGLVRPDYAITSCLPTNVLTVPFQASHSAGQTSPAKDQVRIPLGPEEDPVISLTAHLQQLPKWYRKHAVLYVVTPSLKEETCDGYLGINKMRTLLSACISGLEKRFKENIIAAC
jgi:hypothetical protein